MGQVLEEDQKFLDYIAHYGTKGMKWGVRKAPETSGKETRAARKEVREVGKTARDIRKSAKKARTTAERKAVVDRYEKDVLKQLQSKEFKETWAKANTMTKGQKVFQVLMSGPFAGIAIKNLQQQYGIRREGGLALEIGVAKSVLSELKNS